MTSGGLFQLMCCLLLSHLIFLYSAVSLFTVIDTVHLVFCAQTFAINVHFSYMLATSMCIFYPNIAVFPLSSVLYL